MNWRTRQIIFRSSTVCIALVLWQVFAMALRNPHLAPGIPYLFEESYPSFALFGNSATNDYGIATRTLAWNALRTTERALLGLALGSALGVVLGVAIFALRTGRRSAQSILGAATSIPLFGLMPLFVYWFAGRELGIILYVVVAVSLITATATYEATLNVPRQFQWQACLAGAGRTAILRSVIFPAIVPELVLTFRWALGLVWAFTLGAEYLSSYSSGCGFLVYESYLYADVGKMLVMAGVYALLGSISMAMFNWAMKSAPLRHFTNRWEASAN